MPNTCLANLGNTCYLNAVVQILFGEPNIARALDTERWSSPLACRLVELAKMMRLMQEGTELRPTALYDAIYDENSSWVQHPYGATQGQQQCADEFLQFLLANVSELAKCVTYYQYEGTQQSTKLLVNLVHENAPLSALIHAQYAGADADGAHQLEMSKLSNTLIVIMKRWSFSRGTVSKDEAKICISEPLEIFDKENVCIGQFTLSGYVQHLGSDAKSGHYTATSKRRMPDGTMAWLNFDDAKKPLHRGEADVLAQGGGAFIFIFTKTGDRGHRMAPKLSQQVTDVKKAMRTAEEAYEHQQRYELKEAYEHQQRYELNQRAYEALRNSGTSAADLDAFAQMHKLILGPQIAMQKCAQMATQKCPDPCAMRAVQVAASTPPQVAQPSSELPRMDHLPMWENRLEWKMNPDILKIPNGAELAYQLVYAIVGKHEIYSNLLSQQLDDTNITVFIERPEQSGKTFTCTLMSWLSNICFRQAAYVLLRSGGQASEDYGKYGLSVDDLNRMIYQVMLGYTFDGSNVTGPFRKVDAWYQRRLYQGDLHTDSAMAGFMKPFILHSYNLRHDKTLTSDDARNVLKGQWPLVFSRLCTPANIARGIRNEMETIITAFGVDEYGFANLTLLNDEYQQNVKEGTRVQEEMHQQLIENDSLFKICAGAIEKNEGKSKDDAIKDMKQRLNRMRYRPTTPRTSFRTRAPPPSPPPPPPPHIAAAPPLFSICQSTKEGYAPPSPGGSGSDAEFEAEHADFEGLQARGTAPDGVPPSLNRWGRSAISACIKSHVRISATILSGQTASEEWDQRKSVVVELGVDPDYYGHECSTGIDPSQQLRIEWVGHPDLIFLADGDYPTLPTPPPRIQHFVMKEVDHELLREGYAHIALQALSVKNNAGLLDIARYLVKRADEIVAKKHVIAITAYMYTTTGDYPGGPWLVFSQGALPLRNMIASTARELFVDADPKSSAGVPAGKIALREGAKIAPSIEDMKNCAQNASLANALQLPMHPQMYLKNVLALLNGAIERCGLDKKNIKIITTGAQLFKVGMTIKTPDHKMSITLGLLCGGTRQLDNLTCEDISQGMHGRTSGSRNPQQDPYWAARGNDEPPKFVAAGSVKDKLSTYKRLQQNSNEAAKKRAQGETLTSAMTSMDFNGFSDLPRGTRLFVGQTRALTKKRGVDTRVESTIDSIRNNSTGTGAWKRSRIEGCLETEAEVNEMIRKFDDLKSDYPMLFETTSPGYEMPGWNQKIWKKWRPEMPHYYQATVINADVLSEGADDERLQFCIRFDDTNEVMLVFLDPDMTEWSYNQPQLFPDPDMTGGSCNQLQPQLLLGLA